MTSPDEYNPLDYQNLTRHCVDELMRRGPFELPLKQDFFGAGVYALFYKGSDPIYAKVSSPNAEWPIYVGKAVPPGGRKGGGKPAAQSKSLSGRLAEHTASIKAASNLSTDDFLCRYLVVDHNGRTLPDRALSAALEHRYRRIRQP